MGRDHLTVESGRRLADCKDFERLRFGPGAAVFTRRERLAAGFENAPFSDSGRGVAENYCGAQATRRPCHQCLLLAGRRQALSSAAWGAEGILSRVHDMTKNPPEAVDELKGFRITDISPDGRFLVAARGVA